MRRLGDEVGKIRTGTVGWIGIPLAALAMLVLMLSGAAVAHVSPPGCSNNGIDLSVNRAPGTVQPGDTINFTVAVANGPIAAGDCDVTNATVTLTLPNAVNGSPTGTVVTLATAASFPADGSAN